MIVMQVIWCCRMKYGGLLALGIMNVICGITSVIAAIYILRKWPNDKWCNVYTLFVNPNEYATYYDNEEYYDSYWLCNYRAWVIVELIGAILWFVAAYGPIHFITSGKLARYNMILQERIDEQINAGAITAIEMGTIPTTTTQTTSTNRQHDVGGGTPVAMAPARIITEVDPETNQTMGKLVVAAVPTTTTTTN